MKEMALWQAEQFLPPPKFMHLVQKTNENLPFPNSHCKAATMCPEPHHLSLYQSKNTTVLDKKNLTV